MHKVIYVPNKNKIREYKEYCQTAFCKGNDTSWIYSDVFIRPCCKHCKVVLEGKDLMNRQSARLSYHLNG